MEKDSGELPFNAPVILKELFTARDFVHWADPQLQNVPAALRIPVTLQEATAADRF
jgi:hypothetical protein